MRRKVKTVHKGASTDDKRLQGTFKRLGLNPIAGIEEVRRGSRGRPGRRAAAILLEYTSLPRTLCHALPFSL